MNKCNFPSGHYQHYKHVDSYVNGTAMAILTVISHLKWSSVCVIFDRETEHQALWLQQGLAGVGTFIVMYRMEEMNSEKIDALKTLTNPFDQPELNFTILCRVNACLPFLKQPFDYQRKNIWRSSLIHFTKWIVVVFEDGNLEELEVIDSSPLDNVAVIQFPRLYLQSPVGPDCCWLTVRTLMWHEGRRGLSCTGYLKVNGSFLIKSEIFPNEKFAFNQRQLLVSILPWAPFVVHDNRSDSYSGINIELLNELSVGLNFTNIPAAPAYGVYISQLIRYSRACDDCHDFCVREKLLIQIKETRYEFLPPRDGLWGIASENNTWSGMIGQLQRREVDIVAAPIAIQTHRETVMDFTQPYFYESSAILLRKPDPEATKWRTLIDPFSPKVFLLIGISLPLTSFLLCFFEKYNPFYRSLSDRRKVRGLHHFSDSFWYMYGALLTQGGEHIAASSSGRTLLSCWWLFCIITVATYSGNFVAFFTVTKDRLPFKDLEGLVSQNTYKWGTAGGTVYETIFMNSELEERKKMWNGILDFNKSDPSVLSSNPTDHINKVMDGSYAYVADKTFMDVAQSKHCDLAVSAMDILPLQYAIGLPDNSPYNRMFSDEINAILESGLVQLWKQRNWPKTEQCKSSVVTEAKKLTVIDLQSGFYLLGIGIFLAGVSLWCEILKFRYNLWFLKRNEKSMVIKHIRTLPRKSISDIRSVSTYFDES